eukprot:4895600-Prymnesium_polylepis.1
MVMPTGSHLKASSMKRRTCAHAARGHDVVRGRVAVRGRSGRHRGTHARDNRARHGPADRAGHAGGDHVVVGRLLLQHHPHHLHVVARVAPVALGVDVAHEELVLQPLVDARDRTRHLSRDERGPSARRLVVEEDAVGRVDAVRLAVVDDDPVG